MTTRDKAYIAYLKENPLGNFIRFTQLSNAGRLRHGDPTARQAHPVPAHHLGRLGDRVEGSATTPGLPAAARSSGAKELRRKIAWAVGSVYGVKYTNYDSWPADYARRASERLIEIHGEP